jgi:hypothetical protein
MLSQTVLPLVDEEGWTVVGKKNKPEPKLKVTPKGTGKAKVKPVSLSQTQPVLPSQMAAASHRPFVPKLSTHLSQVTHVQPQPKSASLEEHKETAQSSMPNYAALDLANDGGNDMSIGSNTLPSVLAGSPYVNGYKRISQHELHKNVKQLMWTKKKIVQFNHGVHHLAKYISPLGRISSDKDLLIDESATSIHIAKQIGVKLQQMNQAYKDKHENEIIEEVKCVSLVGIKIFGKQFYLLSTSGSSWSPSAMRMSLYLKQMFSKDSSYIILPAISNQFKHLVDFLGKFDLQIPDYNIEKNCAEFSFLATLAKLYYIYGKNMVVTGAVNLPVAVADMRNRVQSDKQSGTIEQKLSSWRHGEPWMHAGHTIHHWKCCNNCKNNKPLYLSILGVMQDLGSKRLMVDTGSSLAADIEEAVTSPISANIERLVGSVMPEETKDDTSVSQPPSKAKQFNYADGCRASAAAASVQQGYSPHALYSMKKPKPIMVADQAAGVSSTFRAGYKQSE